MGTFGSVEEAERAKRQFERAKKRRRRGFKDWTVAEFCAIWCVEDYLRPQESSNEYNRRSVRAFARDFGDRLLREVAEETDLLRLWALGGVAREDLESTALGWQDSERRRGRVYVRPHVRNARVVASMFDDARRSELVETNGMRLVKFPPLRGRRDIDPLRPAQVQALLRKARDLYEDVPDVAAAIAVAAYAGLRIGEVFGLRWEDLDLERFRVHVRRQVRAKIDGREVLPKNGKTREVVLPPVAVDELRRIVRHVDGYVFHTRTGRRMTQRTWHYYWDSVRKGIEPPLVDLDFHELRHFCGSNMAARGANARQIAYQLGHVDGGILASKLYVHDYREETQDAIGALFGV